MRRKSERSATKKTKASPEKKVEKVRRITRTSRRKQSISSENESGGEINVKVPEVIGVSEKNLEQTTTKADSPEETQEQVWQVKAAEGSGDVGEIQKIKICLTRPPSTPERVDRSPRSKRKHSRTASCSDSTSAEGSEEKKKIKHRSKQAILSVSSETLEKSDEAQADKQESDTKTEVVSENISTAIIETPTVDRESMLTEASDNIDSLSKSNEDMKLDESIKNDDNKECDITSTQTAPTSTANECDTQNKLSQLDEAQESKDEESKHEDSENQSNGSTLCQRDDKPERKRSMSIDKSEVLEIHAEESKGDISDLGVTETQIDNNEEDQKSLPMSITTNEEVLDKVSINEDKIEKNVLDNKDFSQNEKNISTNETDVVANLENTEIRSAGKYIADTTKDSQVESNNIQKVNEQTESAQSGIEETVHNGHTTVVINRKRRWGSRPNKLTTQKSLTISTEVLKEIIPDVKPVEFDEVIEEKKQHKRVDMTEKIERPILPKIVIDNTENVEQSKREPEVKNVENVKLKETPSLAASRKISIVKDNENIALIRPPSPPKHKQSNILYITNLVRPFTLPQLKNLLQRTGRIAENGFWIDRIKSKCFVIYETEDQAVETRHALHGVTWPVSNPKTLHVDFSTQEEFDKAKLNEDSDNAQASTIPGTVEDWLREQDMKRERGELEKPWERKTMREWDVGKNEKLKEKEKEKLRRDDRSLEKRRHHTPERSPEPAKKFKKKEEAPAKLLDDLFRKTKTTPCIYWLPLSAETIAIKEEQRRQHMAEHERRLQELRRTHRRH